jgi:hypothetical protein
MQLPGAITHPSPTALLVSWLLLTFVVLVYYETDPGHMYRKVFLLGSVMAAITIGVMEQSSVDTVILTNLPWCLALSTLVDTLLWCVHGVTNRCRSRDSPTSKREHDFGTEKIDLA